jgi:hypothetical protein
LQFIIPPARPRCTVGFGTFKHIAVRYIPKGKIEHYVDGRTQRRRTFGRWFLRPRTLGRHQFPTKVTSRCKVRVFYNSVITLVVLRDFQGRLQVDGGRCHAFQKGHRGHSHCSAVHLSPVGALVPWPMGSPFPLMVADHWQGTQDRLV